MLKNLILLTGFTFFVVAVWVGLGIYHNITTSTIAPTTNIRVLPISPNFDEKTVNELKARKNISVNLRENVLIPSVENNNQSTESATPTQPFISPTPGGEGT